jgi:cytoskeleton protein RodZ
VSTADNAARVDNTARVDNAAGVDNAAMPPAASVKPEGDNAAAPPAAQPSATISAGGGTGPLTGPFQLFLEAGEHTWVMYSFDGGDPIDVTLFMGDKISIQAEKTITLKIGNAGGVVGTLNGQRLPPFGKSGQVRNITFGQ